MVLLCSVTLMQLFAGICLIANSMLCEVVNLSHRVKRTSIKTSRILLQSAFLSLAQQAQQSLQTQVRYWQFVLLLLLLLHFVLLQKGLCRQQSEIHSNVHSLHALGLPDIQQVCDLHNGNISSHFYNSWRGGQSPGRCSTLRASESEVVMILWLVYPNKCHFITAHYTKPT